jgi:hypothetical protein
LIATASQDENRIEFVVMMMMRRRRRRSSLPYSGIIMTIIGMIASRPTL